MERTRGIRSLSDFKRRVGNAKQVRITDLRTMVQRTADILDVRTLYFCVTHPKGEPSYIDFCKSKDWTYGSNYAIFKNALKVEVI